MAIEQADTGQSAFFAHGVTASDTVLGPFQVEIHAAGAVILADEPVDAGGLGSGPAPHQLLASGLAACTIMTLRLYARRKGWLLQGVRVRVLHSPPAEGGKDRFAREIELDGLLDDVQRQRLLEVANRCPVHRTLERGSDLITSLADDATPSDVSANAGRPDSPAAASNPTGSANG